MLQLHFPLSCGVSREYPTEARLPENSGPSAQQDTVSTATSESTTIGAAQHNVGPHTVSAQNAPLQHTTHSNHDEAQCTAAAVTHAGSKPLVDKHLTSGASTSSQVGNPRISTNPVTADTTRLAPSNVEIVALADRLFRDPKRSILMSTFACFFEGTRSYASFIQSTTN